MQVQVKNRKIGLVLGGGGARGLAHIGVINVLQREGIPIHYIAGSSMGALIGGIFAQNPQAEVLDNKVRSFLKGPGFKRLGINNFRYKTEKDPDDVLRQISQRVKRQLIINLAANRLALLKAERLSIVITSLLENSLIEDCKIPFSCVASDLYTGEAVVFNSGQIRPAVEGSSAIPGFIPPVKYNEHMLIDGSVSNNFPVDIVRKMGADFVIAIDASLTFNKKVKVDNVVDLIIRSAQITVYHLDIQLKKQADYVIKADIGNVHWSEFNRVDELIQKGEEAAKKVLPEVKNLLQKRKRLFRRLFI
jgi:NTE family protein